MKPIVLRRRLCGMPRRGLYAIGEMSPDGTLLPFTALLAPFEAEIANPRAPQVISIPTTLSMLGGLWPPTAISDRLYNLPRIGLADLWGRNAGYKYVIDVIEETKVMGISRRIAAVPNVPLPCPVLMLHMDAVVLDADEQYQTRPWLKATSLGHVGDDTYIGHPYIRLYSDIGDGLRKAGPTRPGVFGLSWITNFVYCLGPDEDRVPPHLEARGVLPAYAEDDERLKYEAYTD